MNFYILAKDICKEKFNFDFDQELGYGAQGRVWSIKNHPDKVIKLSLLYDVNSSTSIEEVFSKIKKVYEHIINVNPANLVKVFDFGELKSGSRSTFLGSQKYIIYYSIQEKLQPLSDDEKKVFKTICQVVNNELELERDAEEILIELKNWLTFQEKKVMIFYNSLLDSSIRHNDFHRRNIMKDANGNFKLIDFDLAELEEEIL